MAIACAATVAVEGGLSIAAAALLPVLGVTGKPTCTVGPTALLGPAEPGTDADPAAPAALGHMAAAPPVGVGAPTAAVVAAGELA